MAAHLLNQFANEFGLDRVEGKQDVTGQRSKTNWEIDAKGVRDKDGAFMVVECRRYTTSKQSQEKIGGLAYRIIDTQSDQGYMPRVREDLRLESAGLGVEGKEFVAIAHP